MGLKDALGKIRTAAEFVASSSGGHPTGVKEPIRKRTGAEVIKGGSRNGGDPNHRYIQLIREAAQAGHDIPTKEASRNLFDGLTVVYSPTFRGVVRIATKRAGSLSGLASSLSACGIKVEKKILGSGRKAHHYLEISIQSALRPER